MSVEQWMKHYFVYCINTNEIPGDLSHQNMISSDVKITCYLHTWKDNCCCGYTINGAFHKQSTNSKINYKWFINTLARILPRSGSASLMSMCASFSRWILNRVPFCTFFAVGSPSILVVCTCRTAFMQRWARRGFKYNKVAYLSLFNRFGSISSMLIIKIVSHVSLHKLTSFMRQRVASYRSDLCMFSVVSLITYACKARVCLISFAIKTYQ